MSRSGLDFSHLKDLPSGKVATKGEWSPLTPEDLKFDGLGLSFDQSLTATGWVILGCTRGRVEVMHSQTIRPKVPEDLTGFYQDLARGAALYDIVVNTPDFWTEFDVVVHETPPVGARTKLHGDGTSSKLAAQALWCAFTVQGVPLEMVQAQAAKKTMTGKGSKVEKKEAHAAMMKHCAPWVNGIEKVTNEHERDALMNLLHRFQFESGVTRG